MKNELSLLIGEFIFCYICTNFSIADYYNKLSLRIVRATGIEPVVLISMCFPFTINLYDDNA